MLWIDEIITGVNDMYPKYDIYELYDVFKIHIIYLDRTNILLKNNDALYHRGLLDEEKIFIRNDLDDIYEKFVLTHELGHALLHTHIGKSTFNPLRNLGRLDKEANYFAVKILDVKLDSIDLEGFTLNQIASALELPIKYLQIVNDIKGEYIVHFERRCEVI